MRPLGITLRLAGAALLLAAGVGLTGGTASAACGDHVTILSPAGIPGDGPAKPCFGPDCHAAPAPADAPAAALPEAGRMTRDLAAPVVTRLTDGLTVGRPAPVSDDGTPVSRASLPFDPPRSV